MFHFYHFYHFKRLCLSCCFGHDTQRDLHIASLTLQEKQQHVGLLVLERDWLCHCSLDHLFSKSYTSVCKPVQQLHRNNLHGVALEPRQLNPNVPIFMVGTLHCDRIFNSDFSLNCGVDISTVDIQLFLPSQLDQLGQACEATSPWTPTVLNNCTQGQQFIEYFVVFDSQFSIYVLLSPSLTDYSERDFSVEKVKLEFQVYFRRQEGLLHDVGENEAECGLTEGNRGEGSIR